MVNSHELNTVCSSYFNIISIDVKSALNGYLPEKKIKKNQEYLETPQLAFAMKEGTKVVHKAAENSIFTK